MDNIRLDLHALFFTSYDSRQQLFYYSFKMFPSSEQYCLLLDFLQTFGLFLDTVSKTDSFFLEILIQSKIHRAITFNSLVNKQHGSLAMVHCPSSFCSGRSTLKTKWSDLDIKTKFEVLGNICFRTAYKYVADESVFQMLLLVFYTERLCSIPAFYRQNTAHFSQIHLWIFFSYN